MRNIVFNSFKEKVLSGKVPEVIEASGLAVKSDFFDQYDNTDISLEQYRNIEDFKTYSRNVRGMKSMDSTLFEYSSFKVEYSAYEPDDYGTKPLFVNSDNSGKFFQAFQNDVGDEETKKRLISYMTVENPNDNEAMEDLINTNSGFYYVTKKSHLNWLADRTNNENNFNNKVRIVFGDDIGNKSDIDTIESMFCTSPERPFNGIMDLNGHKLVNKRFICKNNSNGLIGYLGPRGVVRNGIVENYIFENRQKISLDKIVNDCSDVFAGALVGTNWGTVENIITSGEFRFDGFCPEVYLVNNKYEYTEGDSTNTNSAYNGFFPNKFCINSIYNILPYCGYFNEGIDSTYNDIGRSNIKELYDKSDSNSLNNIIKYNAHSCLGYVDFEGHSFEDTFNTQHYVEPMMSNSDMFDQSSIRLAKAIPSTDVNGTVSNITFRGYEISYCLGDLSNVKGDLSTGDKVIASPIFPVEFTQYHLDRVACNTINNLGQWETHDGKDTYAITPLAIDQEGEMIRKDFDHGSYLVQQIRDAVAMSINDRTKNAHHQRMNPNARIAYYCSPLVGNNFGIIRNIDCRHTIVESMDTFVGFIGNVCGKQNCGTIHGISGLYSIRELNDVEKETAQNITKNYTRDHRLKPDYPESYTNIVQLLAYNYDYYQNPNGLSNKSDYTERNKDGNNAVRVSQKFYDFHDFVCSGVERNWYTSENSDHQFVFNVYSNKSADYANCNFRVLNDSDVNAPVGSDVPEKIRNAKLKFGCTNEINLDKFQIAYQLEEFQKGDDDYYPYQGEVKLFDTFDDMVPGNSVKSFVTLTPEDRASLKQLLRNINFTVKHFDFNYLGDACKSVAAEDKISGLNTCKNTSNEDVELTAKDVLQYATTFNGPCGNTLDGAIDFAKNIMYSKAALGGNLLGNMYFDLTKNTEDYYEPFVETDVNGPFGTTNSEDDSSTYVIPSKRGPNDTDSNWEVFSTSDNGPDMCWYMPPADSSYGSDGPKAKDPERSLYSKTVNSKAFNTNYFCSIRPDYNFDIWFTNNRPVDQFSQFGIQRSMITITPMDSVDLDNLARDLCVFLEDKLSVFGYYTRKSDGKGKNFDTALERLDDAFGADWFAKITKISIPCANKTQNKTYSSPEGFEGESGVKGLYLDLVDSSPKNLVDRDSNGKLSWVDDADPYDDHFKVGNLQDMFVEMTLFKVRYADNHSSSGSRGQSEYHEPEYIPYQMILRLPISRLRIPISAYTSEEPTRVATPANFATENFAQYLPIVAGETDYHSERKCKFWPLIPAYDPEEKNGTVESFKLKSIYNIGGIAGMINHSEKYEEYGNWQTSAVYNWAQMGSIFDCAIKMTDETMAFINRLTSVYESYYGEEILDSNPRAIGIACKFGMVAPVFEYHQNEVGMSPDPGISKGKKDENTNLLSFIYAVQYSKFQNIHLIGATGNKWTKRYENNILNGSRPYQSINTRIFNPFIEWINFCDVLDYNNFFYKRYCWNIDAHTIYTPWTSSNYPETVNLLHNWCSLAAENDSYNLKVRWGYNGWAHRDFWPLYTPRRDDVVTMKELVGSEDMNTMLANSLSTAELWKFGSNGSSVRNSFCKTYEYVPSYVILMDNVFDFPDGVKQRERTDWVEANQWYSHMSPMIDSPNSDYGDINSQLLNGSPNFCFDKLNKTIVNAPIFAKNVPIADGFERQIPMMNEAMYNLYMSRIQNNITDRYFTWDYDMYPRGYNDPLEFVIKYKNVENTRGLWIHQQIRDVDKPDPDNWLRYAMKGKDECMNDGSSIHLGYMPSEWALINIMNRDDRNILPAQVGDEGVAVSGDDFRGILLFEKKTNDLIAMVDGGYGRNINSGCYIAELPKKFVENEVSGYGLLCEIDAE